MGRFFQNGAEKVCKGLWVSPYWIGSTARHKRRFSIGSFQRLKKEQVNAELDKTLEADAQIVELKRQLAAKKVEIDALGKQLHKKEEIVRRRKRKVHSDHHCVFWYILWFLEDLLVHVQQLLF